MNKEYFDFEVKSVDNNGFFAGYASVFNVSDSQNDVIMPGAFSQSILENMDKIKLLWQHMSSEPIGYISSLKEDDYGLYVEGVLLLDIQKAKEAYLLMANNAMRGMSIGYTVKHAEYDHEKDIRFIKELNLWEISLVTFPANNLAQVLYLKTPYENYVITFEKEYADRNSVTLSSSSAGRGSRSLRQ